MSAFKQRYIVELEKMLFVENKKTVKFSNFQCLEEAVLETANGEIPKYLQDIACKIKNACGTKETENVPNINALILLCAAIHEMDQYMGVELLNWDRLLTWGATYNKAKDAGFKVEFIEKHLKKIWYAFIGSYLKTCGNNGNTELKMMEKCLSAEESFQGKPLSHGLFSQ
ncbi:serine/threonine-protein kinase ATR [Corchorus olitorius]|uniref:Serine/threonine-protein kinase ATR n=1 Tax=Corchorus olitorius TaxID=93759 RepID=A0A1R3HDE7_9ROSI|nr:serine/threonine-protein kinase ATR [Corchorus olitorius]